MAVHIDNMKLKEVKVYCIHCAHFIQGYDDSCNVLIHETDTPRSVLQGYADFMIQNKHNNCEYYKDNFTIRISKFKARMLRKIGIGK